MSKGKFKARTRPRVRTRAKSDNSTLIKFKHYCSEDTSPEFNPITGKPIPNTAPYQRNNSFKRVKPKDKEIDILRVMQQTAELPEFSDRWSQMSWSDFPEFSDGQLQLARRIRKRVTPIHKATVKKMIASGTHKNPPVRVCAVCEDKFPNLAEYKEHLLKTHLSGMNLLLTDFAPEDPSMDTPSKRRQGLVGSKSENRPIQQG